MAQYGKSEYWEDRYQKDKEPFDWYQRYGGLKHIITQAIQPTFTILNVGCGNSRKLVFLIFCQAFLKRCSMMASNTSLTLTFHPQ